MRTQRSIGAGQQALGASFLVAGGAVDLAGEEQAADDLGLQAVPEISGIEEVVLDRIARPHDVGVFHATDGTHDLQLHVERQGRGNAVGIQLVGRQAFRLEEDLVAFLVGEAMDLVFDRRAVARADAFDHTGIHRRTIEIGGDDLVGPGVGMGDPATDLLGMLFLRTEEGHHRDRRVARLLGHHREVHAAPVDPRRRTGLQPADPQRQFTQTTRQCDGRRVAGASA